MVRALDRYVFVEFWKIFVTTALGFPVLVNIIDLTDNLDKYLAQQLSWGRIALSYLYWLPDSMFMVLPAAVLFATVFAIGSLTRHSEITAAKASGISFYRFIAPIFAGAIIATFLGLILGELAPITNKKRLEILDANRVNVGNDRYNFAYAADGGRIYKIGDRGNGDRAEGQWSRVSLVRGHGQYGAIQAVEGLGDPEGGHARDPRHAAQHDLQLRLADRPSLYRAT